MTEPKAQQVGLEVALARRLETQDYSDIAASLARIWIEICGRHWRRCLRNAIKAGAIKAFFKTALNHKPHWD